MGYFTATDTYILLNTEVDAGGGLPGRDDPRGRRAHRRCQLVRAVIVPGAIAAQRSRSVALVLAAACSHAKCPRRQCGVPPMAHRFSRFDRSAER
jgi:hypothetical protein